MDKNNIYHDGDIWAQVSQCEDGTWAWTSRSIEDGAIHRAGGFATAEEAKSSAEAAYTEWLEDFGDPLATDEPIELPTAVIGTLCDIYGHCPYGCEIGDGRCITWAVFTEADLDCED